MVGGTVPDSLSCPACAAAVDPAQRYCGSCGAPVGHACEHCGAANPPAHKFCGSCGAALDTPARFSTAEERRWATVVFADLSGFTALSERMDPEEVRALADRCTEKLAEVVERFGGWVNRVVGDAVLAVFGAPVAHEDDAERAVRAALEMQRCAVENAAAFENLSISIGINSGETMFAPVGPDGARALTVMGDVVNTASRLQHKAGPGGILVGESTYRATHESVRYTEIEPFEAKGKSAPVRAWVPVEVVSAPAERRVSRAPLVGRDRELQLMLQLWERVAAEQRPHLVTVIGPPGIGKTRLTQEFLGIAPDARILRGRCVPYGDMQGYGAFTQQLRELAGIFESDSAESSSQKLERCIEGLVAPEDGGRIADQMKILLGLEVQATSDRQLFRYAVRQVVEAIARDQPTIFVFEDIHWADPSLLDVIEMLAARAKEAPALFLALCRPDLLTARPGWGGGLASYTALPLEPLQSSDALALVTHYLDRADLEPIAQELTDRAGGNPLFIEELAASVGDATQDVIGGLPVQVQGIIAARLDALSAPARAVLLDASVVGKVFWRGVLTQLSSVGELDDALDLLEARDFIRREPTSSIRGDTEFTFKHMLIREVAYARLPKSTRRANHAAVARYFEQAAANRSAEHASLLAHHWKEGGEIVKAIDYLLLAAEKAQKSFAMMEAVDLLDQVLTMIDPQEHQRRTSLRLRRARLLADGGDYARAVQALDELVPDLEGDELGEAIFLRGRTVFWLADVEGVRKAARDLSAFARTGDHGHFLGLVAHLEAIAQGLGGNMTEAVTAAERSIVLWPQGRFEEDLANARLLAGINQYWLGRFDKAEEYSRVGYEAGLEIQSVEAVLSGGGQLCAVLTGQGRHEEALQLVQDLLERWREIEAEPRLTARAMNMWAGTLRELYLFAESRERTLEAIDLGRQAAFQNAIAQGVVDLVFTDIAAGDFARALSRMSDARVEATKLKGWHEWLVSTRLDEAHAWIALETATPDEAVALATASLETAGRYGRLKYEVSSRLALAASLERAGQSARAVSELRRALAQAEQLGHPPTLWRSAAALAAALYRTGKDTEAEAAYARARSVIGGFIDALTDEHRSTVTSAPEISEILSTGSG